MEDKAPPPIEVMEIEGTAVHLTVDLTGMRKDQEIMIKLWLSSRQNN